MSELAPELVFGKRWKPIVLKASLFSIIWVVFWYATTMLFFKDVEAAAWAAGLYAYPIAIAIAMSIDYFISIKCPKLHSFKAFLAICILLLVPGPLWSGFVFWLARIL